MQKLTKLRSWLNIEETAQCLRQELKESVKQSDVLRLALDGHLIASVNLINTARARRGNVTHFDRTTHRNSSDSENYRLANTVQIDDSQVVRFDSEIVDIQGVYDLSMLGIEKMHVEDIYQRHADGPSVLIGTHPGLILTKEPGEFFQLVTHFRENEFLSYDDRSRPFDDPWAYYPAVSLPDDAILVFRLEALQRFIEKSESSEAQPEDHLSKPLRTRERTALLVIIAALASLTKTDLEKPSKAAQVIASEAHRIGLRIGIRTIEGHLKNVADAVERRLEG